MTDKQTIEKIKDLKQTYEEIKENNRAFFTLLASGAITALDEVLKILNGDIK